MDKPKILIVEDDVDLRRGLNLRLRTNHYETAYASDGFSAVAMAHKDRPDLILLDLGLPAGDGFSVMERLQQSASLSNIPVIVLTAKKDMRDAFLPSPNIVDFIEKPFDPVTLRARVKWALGKSS